MQAQITTTRTSRLSEAGLLRGYKNMKNLIFLLCCSIFLHSISTSVTSAAPTTLIPATPTYTVAVTPVVTPHSHQVVARNYNRFYVPAAGYVPATYVPAVRTSTVVASYPYATTTAYRYGYGYYPAYGYSYGYGTAVPTALWR